MKFQELKNMPILVDLHILPFMQCAEMEHFRQLR